MSTASKITTLKDEPRIPIAPPEPVPVPIIWEFLSRWRSFDFFYGG